MALNINGINIGGGISVTSPPVPTAIANAPLTAFFYINSLISTYTTFTSVTGGTAPYTYFIKSGTLPTGLTLNSSTGVVSGTPTAIYGPNILTFSVKDANGQIPKATTTATITVATLPVATTNTTPPVMEAWVTTAGTYQPLTITTGTGYAPYTYGYTGTLPAGLSYTSGVISGMPTLPGTYSATFTVVDANGTQAVATSTVSFTVATALAATTNITTQNYILNVAITSYNPVMATAGTGVSPYIYSYSGTLPTGLNYSSSTGLLSGTPSVSASATSIIFTVTDNLGVSISATVSIAVSLPYTIGVVLLGGGGGGSNALGGFSGGGGGGLYTTPTTVLPGSNYIITVGAGGGSGPGGAAGSGSTISGPPAFTTVGCGGGVGGGDGRAGSAGAPQSLASGGTWASGGTFNGAAQGAGGGGGGASGTGGGGYGSNGLISGVTYTGGTGGAGTTTPIAPIGTVGGGGGGGVYLLNPAYTVSNQGIGGTGGGGAGGILSPTKNLAVANGTIYTGGGGGGNWGNFGAGSGGSGLVGIIVPTLNYPRVVVTGTHTTASVTGGTAIVWQASGTYTA